MTPRLGLKLAFFDGGGSRCYSQLVVMKELMDTLRKSRYSDDCEKVMRPCDHFNMIGGCDTGGVLAIMFARLQMSTEEAMQEFSLIDNEIYKPHFRSPDQRTQKLKKCLEEMLSRKGCLPDSRLQAGWQEDHCAGFILVTSIIEPDQMQLLRSYSSPGEFPSDIGVVDAIMDALNSYSAPVVSKVRPVKEASIGVQFGVGPMKQFLSEAHGLYGGDSTVACLLSLGSGHSGIAHRLKLRDKSILNNSYQETMAINDWVARETQSQMKEFGIYFRLSVLHGTNDGPNYGDDIEWYMVQTMDYLQDADTIENISRCAHNLHGEVHCIILDRLEQSVQVPVGDTIPLYAQYHPVPDKLIAQDVITEANGNYWRTLLMPMAGFILLLAAFQAW